MLFLTKETYKERADKERESTGNTNERKDIPVTFLSKKKEKKEIKKSYIKQEWDQGPRSFQGAAAGGSNKEETATLGRKFWKANKSRKIKVQRKIQMMSLRMKAKKGENSE